MRFNVLFSMSQNVKFTSMASVFHYLDERIHSGSSLVILFPQCKVCLDDTGPPWILAKLVEVAIFFCFPIFPSNSAVNTFYFVVVSFLVHVFVLKISEEEPMIFRSYSNTSKYFYKGLCNHSIFDLLGSVKITCYFHVWNNMLFSRVRTDIMFTRESSPDISLVFT